jgi:lipopolysaccharide export system permease protein
MLSQLLALFGFFSLLLVGVYWVNRAVGLFDRLIADGQTALVFVEFSLLTLPNVIRLVLPVSAFVAVVYVTNRLTADSELVVMRSTGFSSFRMARPVIVFGLIVGLMMAILTNLLVPASRATLTARNAELSQDVTARFLRDGQFMTPAQGVTLYIRELTETGEILDLYLADDRTPGTRITYTARRALLARSDSGAKLLMFDGMTQELDLASGRLAVTRFADVTYDVGALVDGSAGTTRSREELPTPTLLRADEALQVEMGTSRAVLLEEGHTRLAQPLLPLATALVGFSTLLLGAFSRFGLWRQIGGAVVLLVIVQAIGTQATSLAVRDAALWPLVYAAPGVGILLGLGLLALSQAPGRARRGGGLA